MPGVAEIPAPLAGTLLTEGGFRMLAEAVHDYAIFLLTPGGNIATWNPGAQVMKGYTAQEIIGQHFSIFYSEKERLSGKPQRELEIAAAEGRYQEEGWRVRKDGSRFWASVLITALKEPNGRVIGFGKITRDLTERRQAELKYRLLVEGVTDYAIFSMDPSGHITSWNSGAERIKGYTAQEIIGQHFSRFYTAEDRAAGLPARVLATAVAEGHFQSEGWRVRKDGSRFWASVVVTPVRDEEGQITGFSKVTRDITDRQELLETVRRHAAELELRIAEREQSNAELEAFSYSVSHDLRAPLRAITGFAEALQEECNDSLSATARDYLQEITHGAHRMGRLIQDLLNYSRLARVAIEFTPVPVAEAVAEAIVQCAAAGQDTSAVTVSIAPGAVVRAHAPTLSQVLFNLVTNGLKFHRPGHRPEVVIAGAPTGDTCVITVTDRGIGIAPQHHERIFQVFERLHEMDAYPGTGIGLAIVKRGIERMGGTITLASEAGKGSSFTIELPAWRMDGER